MNVNKSTFVVIRIERNTAKNHDSDRRTGINGQYKIAKRKRSTVFIGCVRKTASRKTVHCFWNIHCSFFFWIMTKIALIARNQCHNPLDEKSVREMNRRVGNNQADINRRFPTVHTVAFANAPLVNFKKFEFEFRLIF